MNIERKNYFKNEPKEESKKKKEERRNGCTNIVSNRESKMFKLKRYRRRKGESR
jgi:hypothetical protein